MDEATWAALVAALTVLGVVWTGVAFRRRGAGNGLRALGFTLLPAAAWLTGTLEMFTAVAHAVVDWATGLVLDPFVWTGIGLAGAAVLLLVASAWLRDRQLARGRVRRRQEPAVAAAGREASQVPAGGSDDETDEVEEILRRRGIR